MKIYTRTGDKGSTQIYADKAVRVDKDDLVVQSYGDMDELNSHIGLLAAHVTDKHKPMLQDIQRKQIDIAQYGLTHIDFDRYLMHTGIDDLARVMSQHLNKVPHPFFTLEGNAFVEAQYILERERDDSANARGWDTDVNAAAAGGQDLKPVEAVDFTEVLERTTKKWRSVGGVVACEAWDIAAYRFQLLTMMADADLRSTKPGEETLDPIISIPVEVDFDQTGEMVEAEVNGEKRTMSRGRLRRIQ